MPASVRLGGTVEVCFDSIERIQTVPPSRITQRIVFRGATVLESSTC